MTVLSGETIRDKGIIAPFRERTLFRGMTYGVSFAGYDIRIREGLWLGKALPMRLASSIEHFQMPRDVVGVVHDKSTWARRGVFVQNTVIEPGWEGFLTLEITGHTWWPVYIPPMAPIAQVVFHKLDRVVKGYSGKYQHQPPVPVPAIHEPEKIPEQKTRATTD